MKKIKKDNVKTTLQAHSQAKVEFYGAYLKRYLRILNLSPHIKKVNIYDVFCGMGIYDDGGKGSPIVAFDAIKELHKETNVTTEITMIINDLDIERVDKVKNYIKSNNDNYCKLRFYNQNVEQMFTQVIKEVENTSTDCRNLVFIDPYGYKNIKKEVLYQLMANKKTEIILFLPISHMQRFTQKAVSDSETTKYKPLRDFVFSYFDEEHEIRSEKVCIANHIDYIKEALRYNGKFYATSYSIQRDQVNHFALFFMSSHLYGFQKILEVKWELDDEAGRGFKLESLQDNLFKDFFVEESQNYIADKLKQIILAALIQPKTNREIYKLALEKEYLPQHVNSVLSDLQKNNPQFKVVDLKKGAAARKGAFYVNWEHYNKKEDRVKFILE